MTMLISRRNQMVVADFSQSSPEKYFRSEALAKSFAFRGIQIPDHLQKFYKQRGIVYLEDEQFLSAFKEIYAPQHFPSASYYWANKTCTSFQASSDLF